MILAAGSVEMKSEMREKRPTDEPKCKQEWSSCLALVFCGYVLGAGCLFSRAELCQNGVWGIDQYTEYYHVLYGNLFNTIVT